MQIPLVFYDLGTETTITPTEPLSTLPEIPRGALVVLAGRAPIWRNGMTFHFLHGSPAAAIATYDPRLGAVVSPRTRPTFKTEPL